MAKRLLLNLEEDYFILLKDLIIQYALEIMFLFYHQLQFLRKKKIMKIEKRKKRAKLRRKK